MGAVMRFHLVEDALKLLAQHGIAGEVERGQRHLKVRFMNELGRRCLLVISLSPSKQRARQENLSQLRRLLRWPPNTR
jgi:hypothetical protein